MANNGYNDLNPLDLDPLWNNFDLLPSPQPDQLLLFSSSNLATEVETNGSQHPFSTAPGHTTGLIGFDGFWGQNALLPNDMQSFRLYTQQVGAESSISGMTATQPVPSILNSYDSSQELVYPDTAAPNGNAARGAEGATLNVQPKRTRRPRSKAPPPSDWLKHKTSMCELYLAQDKTLEETRQIMEDDYAFSATPNLYKQKFQEWQWMKNIPQHWTPELVRLADDRQPKDTVFQLGPRKWTAAEVRRKMERANPNNQKVHSPVLPSGLIIRTPSPSSPQLSVGISSPRRQPQSSTVQFFNKHLSARHIAFLGLLLGARGIVILAMRRISAIMQLVEHTSLHATTAAIWAEVTSLEAVLDALEVDSNTLEANLNTLEVVLNTLIVDVLDTLEGYLNTYKEDMPFIMKHLLRR